MAEEGKRQNLFKRFWVGLKAFLILISGKIKRVWEHPLSYLNAYSTALVALATLGLVYVTYMHVEEAREMRNRFCWTTIRKQLSTQVRITTTMKREDGKIIRIRKSSKVEPSHQEIYDALNLPHQPGKTVKTIL